MFDPSPHLRGHVLAMPLRQRQRKDGYLNLANNELVHPALEPLFAGALAGLSPSIVRMYPHHDDLRDALAAHAGLDAKQLVVTAGSDDALDLVIDALAATSGRLVLQQPNYEQSYPTLRGLEVVPVELAPDGTAAFATALRRACETLPPSTILTCNPSSPVGTCLPLAEMRALAQAAHRRGHLFVIDEAYVGFNGFDHVALVRELDNVVLVRSMSKAFGLAGLRVGFVAASRGIIEYLARWNSHHPVSGITVALVRALLGEAETFARVRADIVAARARFGPAVEALVHSWRALPSAGNFVNIDTGSATMPAVVVEHLRARGILVRAMTPFAGLERCVRFTIADWATMERVLAALAELPSALSQVMSHPRNDDVPTRCP